MLPKSFPEIPETERDDHRVQTPLQNNLVVDEEGEEEEIDPEIH